LLGLNRRFLLAPKLENFIFQPNPPPIFKFDRQFLSAPLSLLLEWIF
jgi:hypothetical protein